LAAWEQPVTQRSENELIQSILAGDRRACVELIERYHAPIFRLLVRLCRDAHWAEDLAQESFLAAWSNIGRFKANSSLNTWLHQIAYRKFIDALRRKDRSVTVDAAAPLAGVRSSDATPYEKANASEQGRRLAAGIDRLKLAEREVVVLHYLQGLSYEQMAQVLSQPSGTVKWRTRQALENLRQLLLERSDS
jgi:RNA polymerase sigma-70 factor, ECF subfamily